MDLDLFAEYFVSHAPLAALVFDNRGFGASDGTPRFEVNAAVQMADIQDAITFAMMLPEVNPAKIALWGTSFSGGNVLRVGAFDRRVKAVLAQNPMVSGAEIAVRRGLPPEVGQLFLQGIVS
jgi:uncharacterized protein